MKISDIEPIIRKLFAAYPNANPSKQTLAVYCEFLADIPLDHLRVVVNQCIIESVEFPPSAGKVRQRYIEMVTPPRLSADDAWGQVVRQIWAVGYIGTPELPDPIVARVVKNMGWRELCASENQMADRAHFMRLYTEAADRERAQRHETTGTKRLTTAAREGGLKRIGDILKLPGGNGEVSE